MKVLLIHNFYRSSSPSGEDIVYRNEVELLRANGVKAITYEKYNDNIVTCSDRLKVAFRIIWSRQTYKELSNLIKKEKPDIAHFHNIFYLISPSAYYACKDAGIPVIQTLHNFRLFCANGLLLRGRMICEDCVGKLPWRGVVHGCYKNSRLYSMPVVLMESFHRFLGTFENKVDSYIALTEFAVKKFVRCGILEEKIFVKPNFFINPPKPSFKNDGYAVFVGRLSMHKGLHILLDAMKMLNVSNRSFRIKIIGDGPLRPELEQRVKTEGISNIELVGKKSPDECIEMTKGSIFMVLPSIGYGGFSMAILEAYACGKPVIASRLGSFCEIVKDNYTGRLFESGDARDLASKMEWMLDNLDRCIQMGRNARAKIESDYAEQKNFEMLIKIYKNVLAKR